MLPLGLLAIGLSATGLAGATGAAAHQGGWSDPAFLIELLVSITGLITGIASLIQVLRRDRGGRRRRRRERA